MSTPKKDSHWIPLADLMTVLMVIFLFMSISYMALMEKKQKEQNIIITNYEESKISLYDELYKTFQNDFDKWDLKLDKDLSIKFTNPQVLFDPGSAKITPYFKNILESFLPKYLNVVLQNKYQDKISEIRIEGHTDTSKIGITNDPYIDNMTLSQNRATNVLAFLRQQICYTDLPKSEKRRLGYWLTANGLSYGRTLDNNWKPTYYSNNPIDKEKSRRVEFRIITSSEDIINEITNKINHK
jgi:outer membrane protein OmpA-like peptidoglycan-associated protein